MGKVIFFIIVMLSIGVLLETKVEADQVQSKVPAKTIPSLPKEHPVLEKLSVIDSRAKQVKLRKKRQFLMSKLNQVHEKEGELLIEEIEQLDDEILAELEAQAQVLKKVATHEI